MNKNRIFILIVVTLLSLGLVSVALAATSTAGDPPLEADYDTGQVIGPDTAADRQMPDSKTGVEEVYAPFTPTPAGILAVSYVYTNTTPVAIPDNGCTAGNYVTSTITVPDNFMIGDLNVGLWVDHTYRGDLEIGLVSPEGTVVQLIQDQGGTADNVNALFDDAAPNAPDSTSHTPPPPYYYAWWYPPGTLADFNDENPQGTWTIEACDDVGGDIGNLNTWTLFFQSGLILNPPEQSGSVCKGNDVVYSFQIVNATAFTDTFTINYTTNWPTSGPSTTPVLPSGATWDFDATVHIPWAASAGDTDVLTVTVNGAGESATATATTTAGSVSGYQDYANAPRPVRDHSVVYYDGKIYKIGGYDGGYQDYLDIYDIATDSWAQGAPMPAGRDYFDCVEIGGKIYCAGGYNAGGKTDLYIYDPVADSWTSGAPLSAYVYTYAGVALNGKYYVIGGYTTPSPYYSSALLEYDPGTDTWNYMLAPMSTPRRYHHAGVIGGKIYVAGGYNGSYLDSAEVYDPATDTWTPIASMPTSWLRGADAVLYDRYLLIFGGDDNSSAVASPYAWSYDAVLDTWSPLADMTHQLFATEADGDGNSVWISSGRLYEAGYRYSEYHTSLSTCPTVCTPVSGADFTVDPIEPWVGLPATFEGSVTAGSPAIFYDWDFGDMGMGQGQSVQHTYDLANTYTVIMTATNCDGANYSVASHDVTAILPPTIGVDPASLHSVQFPNEVTTQTLEICNLGNYPLVWSMTEISPALSIHAPTDIGYAQDIGYISDNFVTFALNDFPGQTVLGTSTDAYYGMDFDPTATTLYALNDTTDELGTINLADGSFTALVSCPAPGANWTGLSIDPVTGVFYASDATSLYTIDPATGAYTLIGPFATSTMIDIAMGPDGTMYGHDIGTDSIYQIDPATGIATLIGPTGYNANYAQGMDFDNDDGTLYIFLYIGSGANVYGTVDLTTGAVTPLATNNPTGEFEGATQTIVPIDIPWLSEDPITGTVPGGSCTNVDVVFDSTSLAVGEYYAGLEIESNDPFVPLSTIPVTLTVEGYATIVVDPANLFNSQPEGVTVTLPLTISNLGNIDLDWAFVGDTTFWMDDFNSYTPGSQMHGQGGWKGWDNSPAAGALVTDLYSHTPNNSIDIVGASDLVHEYSGYTSGSWVYTIWQYIPSGMTGQSYFILLNTYNDAGPYNWSTQVSFNYATGQVVNDGASGGTLPLISDQWVEIRVEIDLDSDTQALYYGGDLLFQGTWTEEQSGGGALNIGAVDLYANGASSVYYDTVSLVMDYPGPCEAPSYIPWLNLVPGSGTTPPMVSSLVDVTLDSTGLALGDYTATLCVESNDLVNPITSVPVALTVQADVLFMYHDVEDVVQMGEDVYLAASFNGWDPGVLMMTPNADYSVFTVTVPLDAGYYEYKYVVQPGDNWDWLNSSNRSISVTDDMTAHNYRNVVVGYAHLMEPPTMTIYLGESTDPIYGEDWIYNVTNPDGEGRSVMAQLGYGTDSDLDTWIWMDIAYDSQNGNNDVYMGVFTPTATGVFSYAVRFDGNWGVGNPNVGWTYGDLDGVYPEDPFELANTGVLTVLEPPIPLADLSLTKADDPDPVYTSATLTYTLVVINDGPDTAANVMLTDTLPAGVTFVTASHIGCAEDGGVVTCDLGNLASSEGITLSITVLAPDTAGTITNTTEVSSDTLDPDTTDNAASEDTEVMAPVPEEYIIYLPIVIRQ